MDLFSWGANSHGQLGLGTISEQCLTPTRVNLEESNLKPERIIQIVGGATHTLILDIDGLIYVTGANESCQLGTENNSSRFIPITNVPFTKFIQISCGWDFSAALTENGDLFVWGSNKFGQLGFPSSHKIISKPTLIAKNIKYVSCGLRHIAIITSEDTVMTSGSGIHGQLGYTDELGSTFRQSSIFKIVPGISNITNIVCGQKYTVAINRNGQVYAWGDNKWGQLGIDPAILSKSAAPIEILKVDPESKLFAGWTHTVLLTQNGEVFNWGRNNYGQLGYLDLQISNWQPRKLICPKLVQLAVGSEHNMAVMEDSLGMLSWGWNEHGNCGNGTEKDILTPTPILNEKVFSIGCGTAQSFAVIQKC